jgi:hypothetical protein
MAQDRAPAAESTDRPALPQKLGGKHRPKDAINGNWERDHATRSLMCQQEQVPTAWRVVRDSARSKGRG